MNTFVYLKLINRQEKDMIQINNHQILKHSHLSLDIHIDDGSEVNDA